MSEWGPRRENVRTWRQDIESHEFDISTAERELKGGTLTLATNAGAENRRNELRGRISKAKAAIVKLEKRIQDAASQG